MWKYQHNLQHWRHNTGKKALPLNPRDTRRLEDEFEAAMEQRGARSRQGDKCAV